MSAVRRSAPPGTQVVLRAIRILKAFSPRRPEWQPAELGEALGLSKTTTHRLLGALESEDLVSRDPRTLGYRLGPATIALGAQARRSNDLLSLVRPELVGLAAATGETASLEILVDGQVLIMDEVSSGHLVSASAETGTRWPLHATSTGKALLAAMPEADRRAQLSAPLARFTAATITDPARLEQELRETRERGWATVAEELEEGYCAAGSAFGGALGEPAGALSVGGPASRLDRPRLESIGELVKAAAGRVSRRLGASGEG